MCVCVCVRSDMMTGFFPGVYVYAAASTQWNIKVEKSTGSDCHGNSIARATGHTSDPLAVVRLPPTWH